MNPSEISFYLYVGLALLGMLAIAAAVFWFAFLNYDEVEEKSREGFSDYVAEIYSYFDRMFMRKSMNQCYAFIMISIGVSAVFGFVLGLQLNILGAFAFGFLGGLLGYRIPGAFMRTIFARRVAQFDRQLVDALTMMSNAIKSGLSFMQVINLLKDEMENPARQEFELVLKENRLGINLNDALLNMVNRMPSEDLFMIINSVVTLSQQGGDLSEAFDSISHTIRERQRVTEKIKTLAQAGTTQSLLLAGIPFVMLLLMHFLNPAGVELLFTTKLGIGMLIFMCVWISIGVYVMRRMIRIEV